MRSSRAAVPLRRCKASSSGQAKMILCPSTIRKLSAIPGRGYLENRDASSRLRAGREPIGYRYEQAAKTGRLGFLSERQARKVISDIFEISNREVLPSDSIVDFFNRWLTNVKVETSPKTCERYGGIVARFLKWLGPRKTL